MTDLFEEQGFNSFKTDYKDLDMYRREDIFLISMKKFKDDKKAFRQASNHIDGGIIGELLYILNELRSREDITSVILTSSHKVAFSRGAKIEMIQDAPTEECRHFIARGQELVLFIQNFPKVVVAAINGLTFGGGLELALACDYRISSDRENVVFGMPEASLGIIPGMGGTVNLPRIIGRDRAYQIIREARTNIFAEEALATGLVEELVPPEQLLAEAFRLATERAGRKNIPQTLSLQPGIDSRKIEKEIKEFLRVYPLKRKPGIAPLSEAMISFLYEKIPVINYRDSLLYEQEIICYLQKTADCREGLKALIEERVPLFTGE